MKKNLKKAVSLLIVFAMIISLAACGKSGDKKEGTQKAASDEDKTFTAALGVMPSNFDPTNLVGAGDMNASRTCYEPLVEEVRGSTELEPWLAESYEVPDAKTYIFKLLEGVKFADGTDLNAEAVVYSYNRAMAFVSSISTLVQEIESVEATDEMTVTIKLKSDNSGFLYNVAKIGIISPTWCKEHEEDGDWAQAYCARHSCGTGAYQISGFEEDQYYTMEKFDDYWGGWKDNQIDKIQTLIVKDNATQIQMLNSGEVDKLQIPITENLDILEANENIDVLTEQSLQTNIFTFNTKKAPFDNLQVRQAVTLAMSYEGVKDNVYNGKATIPSGFMPAKFAEHDDSIPEQSQNLEKAKKLMEQSGVGECKISVHLCEGSDDQVQMAQILQANLAEIGGHVARLLRDSGYLQPSADETVAASRLLGHLLDAHAQVEKPLVAVGLLYRRQVGALRVLHEHDLAFAARVHLLDDRGHGRESRLSGRGEPAVADDDAVLFVAEDVRLAVRRDQ